MPIVGYDPATGRPIVEHTPEQAQAQARLDLYRSRGWVPEGNRDQLLEAYYDPRTKGIVFPRGRPANFQITPEFWQQKRAEAAGQFPGSESGGRRFTADQARYADYLAQHGGVDPNRNVPTDGRQPTYPTLEQLQARGMLPMSQAQLQGTYRPSPDNPSFQQGGGGQPPPGTGQPGGAGPADPRTNPGQQLQPTPFPGDTGTLPGGPPGQQTQGSAASAQGARPGQSWAEAVRALRARMTQTPAGGKPGIVLPGGGGGGGGSSSLADKKNASGGGGVFTPPPGLPERPPPATDPKYGSRPPPGTLPVDPPGGQLNSATYRQPPAINQMPKNDAWKSRMTGSLTRQQDPARGSGLMPFSRPRTG